MNGNIIRLHTSNCFPPFAMSLRLKTAAGITAAAMGMFTSGAFAATFFSDVPANHWAKTSIDWASQAGIMTGPGNMPGKFNPAGQVNRAELATVLARMHEMHAESMLDVREEMELMQEEMDEMQDWMDDNDMNDDDDASSRSSMRSSSRMSNSSGMSWMSSSRMSSSMSNMSSSSWSSMSNSSGMSNSSMSSMSNSSASSAF